MPTLHNLALALGNCSMRCSTSCIHAVVTPTPLGKCSRLCSTSSAAVPDAALPPPSLESCIHAVVPREARRSSRVCSVDIRAVERVRGGLRTPAGIRDEGNVACGFIFLTALRSDVEEKRHQQKQADDHGKGIMIDIAGLDMAHRGGYPGHHTRRAVHHESIDQPHVPGLPQ